MSIEIYYFSGTGNSLHAARELQKRLPGSNLRPIVRELRRDAISTDADTVGFVFPNFCLTLPIPVMEFLQRVDLSSTRYLFALCTRGGSPSRAFTRINKLLRKKRKQLNAGIHVNMPWNLPLGKENLPGTVTAEGVRRLYAGMCSKLDILAGHVIAQTDYIEEDTDISFKLNWFIRAFDALVPESRNDKAHVRMYQEKLTFYTDAKCTGCGICQTICLADKIRLIDGIPKWQADTPCLACFACINYCPRQAIQIHARFPVQSYTTQNNRYHHPGVTAQDIAAQK